MWFLSFIPDSLLHLAILAMMFGGAGLYGASFLVGFFPPAKPYKEPARIIGTLLAIAGVYCFGGYDVEMSWRKKAEEMQSKIAVSEQQSKDANQKLSDAVKAKDAAIKAAQQAVQKNIKRDAAKMDATCKVDPVAIYDLNSAAKTGKVAK
jgi:hypothetical protein